MSARRKRETNAGWAMFRLRGVYATLGALSKDPAFSESVKSVLRDATGLIDDAIRLHEKGAGR